MLKKNALGLETPVSFKGDNLSLGEKQLLSFARILLRKPKILVLDDGRLVGAGKHKELLESCEVYKEICLSQLSEKEVQN